MVIEEFGQLSYPRCIQLFSLSSAFASFCVWVLTRLICVQEYLSIQTCWCLCWLIRRRGRSRVRTKTSCSWQTSWPSRGNSTRQQSFTNTPAMDPKPWACTLICACLITQRWLFCCFHNNKHMHGLYIPPTCTEGYMFWRRRTRVLPCNVQFVPNWGPALCSTGPFIFCLSPPRISPGF